MRVFVVRKGLVLQLCAACATAWNTFAMVLRATLITVAVGVIVYKCKKWCADVVARIEAIESTIQVMQNPPPPRPLTFGINPRAAFDAPAPAPAAGPNATPFGAQPPRHGTFASQPTHRRRVAMTFRGARRAELQRSRTWSQMLHKRLRSRKNVCGPAHARRCLPAAISILLVTLP